MNKLNYLYCFEFKNMVGKVGLVQIGNTSSVYKKSLLILRKKTFSPNMKITFSLLLEKNIIQAY